MGRILVVDDEQSIREMLSIVLRRQGGHEVTLCDSGEEAVKLAHSGDFDVVITDLQMRGLTGIDVLRAFLQHSPGTQIILVTAYATAETAIEAMKLGAYDYLTKPFKNEAITVVVEKAIEKGALVRENFLLRKQLDSQHQFEQIVGRSPAMRRVFEMIMRVARTPATVLILGESGTGKEMTARALHARSDISQGPFVPINCGAIPADLIESELFGHVRGSFTGAHRDKEGLFQAASGGSLFLDEIGELPLSMQVKLLRVLQERKVKRVGSVREEAVTCRIIAASNRNMRDMIREGKFREDLYYRLNVIEIPLPPLRERREDLGLLIDHFIKKYAERYKKVCNGLDSEAAKILMNYPYPGNIRELENIVERLVTLETGELLTKDGLPYHMMQEQSFNKLAEDMEIPDEGLDLEAMVERLERNLLTKALRKAGGVRKKAAQLLGISFRSIRYRLDKYGIGDEEILVLLQSERTLES